MIVGLCNRGIGGFVVVFVSFVAVPIVIVFAETLMV